MKPRVYKSKNRMHAGQVWIAVNYRHQACWHTCWEFAVECAVQESGPCPVGEGA